MDSLHAIGFYVSAAISVIGGLLVAFLADRGRRGIALAVAGVGVTGIYASLSAGFAGLVALVCYAGCAVLLARPDYRTVEVAVSNRWRHVGAIGAAGLFAVIAYAAYRGNFFPGAFSGGPINSTALGKLLFAHDAMATEAVGTVVLVTLVGATAVWRRRGRDR